MKLNIIVAIAASALAVTAGASTADPAKSKTHKVAHHQMHHVKAKSDCKGEFMYMKGNKCMDARQGA